MPTYKTYGGTTSNPPTIHFYGASLVNGTNGTGVGPDPVTSPLNVVVAGDTGWTTTKSAYPGTDSHAFLTATATPQADTPWPRTASAELSSAIYCPENVVVVNFVINDWQSSDVTWLDYLRQISDIAIANSKLLIFMGSQPTWQQSWTGNSASDDEVDRRNGVLKQWCSDNNHPFIDLNGYLRQWMTDTGTSRSTFTPDGLHPGQEGHTLIGHYVATRLQQELVVDTGTGGAPTGNGSQPANLVLEDRVSQLTQTTGTGNITLTNAVQGFRTFDEVMTAGKVCFGLIEAIGSNGKPTGEWETGLFTYVGPNELARTTFGASSTGAKVAFAAGTKRVSICVTAAQIKGFSTSSPPDYSTGGGGGGGTTGGGTGTDPVPFGVAGTWTLTLNEEFDTLSATRWAKSLYWEADNATTNYDVSGGALRIWPAVDGTGNFFNRTLTTDPNSVTGFQQQYGYFEIEAKLPQGAGLHPVISLFNRDEHEIGVMHAYTGAPAGGWSNNTLEPIDFSMSAIVNQSTAYLRDDRAKDVPFACGNLHAAFHKYGIKWDANAIEWYFDGTKVGTTLNHTNMRVPMFWYIGLWMGAAGEYAAAVGSGAVSTSNPYTPQGAGNALEVNYIRAWS